ncbi:hypothetical protein ABIB90_000367 [Bradyrhizobium sp. JR4.1]|uniref:hypothetical protein n=1 Tax=Bradyrhizobium sp. JR4.1 TaxID=3156372 RepID=UPI003390D089
MFGLFKKSIPPSDFGLAVLRYADDFLTNDGCRSLGARFPDYNASKGWLPVFEANGLPLAQAKLYLRYFSHAALQSVFKAYQLSERRSMVSGAIHGIKETPEGYEFGRVFEELEAVLNDQRQFNPRVANLNASGRLDYLAVPTAHVLVSKYLIDRVILPNMTHGEAFIADFEGFSGAVASGLGVTYRAMNSVLSQVKLS